MNEGYFYKTVKVVSPTVYFTRFAKHVSVNFIFSPTNIHGRPLIFLFWETRLTDRQSYTPAFSYQHRRLKWSSKRRIFLWGVKVVSPTVNFTRFEKLVSVNVIFSPDGFLTKKMGKLVSVTAIPIFSSQKKNSSQWQTFGQMKLKIKKTKKKNNTTHSRAYFCCYIATPWYMSKINQIFPFLELFEMTNFKM